MADAQGFIQPLAQSSVPSSVNNGNPATVYNTPQTGAQRPLQGWAASQPAAANLNLNNMAANVAVDSNNLIQSNGWVAPQATQNTVQPMLTVPQGWAPEPITSTPTPGVGGGTVTPTPTTPVKDTSGYQWVVMNGKVPGMNAQLYASDPAYKAAWDQAVAEHQSQFKKGYTKDSDANVIAERLKTLYAQYSANPPATTTPTTPSVTPGSGWLGGNMTPGTTAASVGNYVSNGGQLSVGDRGWASGTGGDSSKMGDALNSAISKFTSLGNNATTENVLQFLDVITEPFLPGNLYMKELGEFNMQNILKSVMNTAMPGLGTLASKIIEAIPESVGGLLGKLRDWVKEGKYNEVADSVYKNVRKQNEKALSGGGAGLDASLHGGFGNVGGWSQFELYDLMNGHTKNPKVDVGEFKNA